MSKLVIIECDLETGQTKIEAHGFAGKQCAVATKPFEEILGSVEERTFKRTEMEKEQPQYLRNTQN